MLDTSLSWDRLSFGYIFNVIREGRYVAGAHVNLHMSTLPVWEYIVQHQQQYNSFPSFTHLRERYNLEYQYLGLPSYSLEELNDRLRLERYKHIAEEVQFNIQKVLTNGDTTEADILNALGSYQDLVQENLTTEVTWLSQFAQIMTDYRNSEGDFVCNYGIPSLDKYTGGLSRGDYVVLYGNTGQGKSNLSRKIAANIASQGKRVLYFTLEESGKKSVLKALGVHICTNFKDLMRGTYTPKTWQTLQSLKVPGDIAFVDRLQSGSVSEVAQYVFQLKPDVVIIDQLPHMIKESGKALWEQAQHLSSKLRQFFQNQKIPAITITQANRAGGKKSKVITVEETIAMSYAIIQDASTGIFIYPDGETPHIKRIQLVKNRDDESNQIIDLVWKLDDGIITEEIVSKQLPTGGNIPYVSTLSNTIQLSAQAEPVSWNNIRGMEGHPTGDPRVE